MATCGGNLISERYVLFAAHCVQKNTKPFVRLGEWNTTGDPDCQGDLCGDLCAPPIQDIKIAEVISHKGYYRSNKGAIKNDIALIRLEAPAKLNFFVQPVCLPYGAAMSKDFTNEDTIAAGWGLSFTITLPFILLALKQTVTDASKCREAYSRIDIDGQVCAEGDIGTNICRGDSGGPLLWKGSFESVMSERTYLLGVSSHGPDSCAKKEIPTVFTRTNFFMKWILDNMRE
ncbi:hypothetical protein WDU94_007836 [Cyamophila willieti]